MFKTKCYPLLLSKVLSRVKDISIFRETFAICGNAADQSCVARTSELR